ncbi:hypothetical protein LMG6001_03033 [Achromobacter insolitus]|nr:hypothetical protein LMG6001_03033 [Achromobacter insolitus]
MAASKDEEPSRSARSLPPEGVPFALGRPGGVGEEPPRHARSARSLPPEGVPFALGRPGGERGFWRPGMARICLPVAALFFVVLVTVGNLPGLAAEMSDAFGDKRLHLAAYAFLTTLIYFSVNRRPALTALLGVAALGALDEAIQSFVPYRQADLLDLLADISAAGATVISLHIGTAAFGSFRAVTKS